MPLLPLSKSATVRREQFAEAARVARELRVTPETTLQELRLTAWARSNLDRMGIRTVQDILADEADLWALEHLSLEDFVGVMVELCNRLVAGGIDESTLPAWVTDSEV